MSDNGLELQLDRVYGLQLFSEYDYFARKHKESLDCVWNAIIAKSSLSTFVCVHEATMARSMAVLVRPLVFLCSDLSHMLFDCEFLE